MKQFSGMVADSTDLTAVERIRECDLENMSDAQVAEMCGCTPKQVTQTRRRLGLRARTRGDGGVVPAKAYFESWAERKARRLRERRAKGK